MFRIAIFDLNGTIIEDEGIWHEAFQQVFTNLGLPGAPETRPGVGVHDNWQHIKLFHPEITTHVDTLVERTLAAYQVNITTVGRYREGFGELMSFLDERNVLKILATSSDQTTWQKIVEHFPTLPDFFASVVTGDMVPERKPAPDIFIKALAVASEMSPEQDYIASDCVVFEDSVAGVIAAKSAGMSCVYLPNGLETLPDDVHPDLTVQDFGDTNIVTLF